MGSGRLSRFCLSRISTHARTPSESKPIAEGPRSSTPVDLRDREVDEDHEAQETENWAKSEASRKIMIVVDSSPEAKRAVLWALSHTVQDHDTVLLLHVVPVSRLPKQPESDDPEEPKTQIDLKDYEVPNGLKTLCNSRRPETTDCLGRRQGEGRRRIGGVLHSKRRVHDRGREKEEQASGRVHHHHQTPEELLALGLAFPRFGPFIPFIFGSHPCIIVGSSSSRWIMERSIRLLKFYFEYVI